MVRDDVEYVYMDHAINSVNLTYKRGALDNFDTVFVPNEITEKEIRAAELKYNTKRKTLVKYGYALIDNMIAAYSKEPETKNDSPQILIAPSWQEENIMDSCIEQVLEQLLHEKYKIIVRPHPQYVRHYSDKLKELKKKYERYENFILQTDFSSNDTVFQSDILVTDWSGIAYEYSFTTLKPCLFVNTPMKIINPDYGDLEIVPFDLRVRSQIGISLELEEIDKIAEASKKLLHDELFSKESIRKLREQYLYNVGNSASVGADYLIHRLIEKATN